MPAPSEPTDAPRPPSVPRYRCSACGNLTRFDVTTTRRTRAFHHYSVGGELRVEELEVLAEDVEAVECRWCGSGGSVVALAEGADPSDLVGAEHLEDPGEG